MKQYLFIALGLGFLLIAFIAFDQGKPTAKAPIYKEIKKYSPYYIDKRFGGLQIMSKEDKEFKEKPVNVEVFRRLDHLEKTWGQSHLKIVDKHLLILDDNGTTLTKLSITSQKDVLFIHQFYGL